MYLKLMPFINHKKHVPFINHIYAWVEKLKTEEMLKEIKKKKFLSWITVSHGFLNLYDFLVKEVLYDTTITITIFYIAKHIVDFKLACCSFTVIKMHDVWALKLKWIFIYLQIW